MASFKGQKVNMSIASAEIHRIIDYTVRGVSGIVQMMRLCACMLRVRAKSNKN